MPFLSPDARVHTLKGTLMATTNTTRSTSTAAKKNSVAQDAVQLLTKDHREVKALFKKYEKLVTADAQPDER